MARKGYRGLLKYLWALFPLALYVLVRGFFLFCGPEGAGWFATDAWAIDLARIYLAMWWMGVIFSLLIFIVILFSDIMSFFRRREEERELRKMIGK